MISTTPPPNSLPPPPRHGFFRRHALKLFASAVITAGLVYTIAKGGLKFVPEGGDWASVKWWTIPVYLTTLAVMYYFRTIRWRFLLRSIADIPKRRLLAVSCIGFAAILVLPFRIGEIVRPYMIREKGKVSLTAATSSVVAERIVDGLYLSIVLAIALLTVPTISPLPETVVRLPVSVAKVRASGFFMLFLFTGAFTAIAVFYIARDFSKRVLRATVGRVSSALAEKLVATFTKFTDGLRFLGRGRDAAGFLVETTLYWGFNALGMWILAWGCGVCHADGSPITFGEACALMGMLGVAILIPGPPGLLGVFQAGIYAGMTMYFPTDIVTGPGAAFVFLLYAIQVLWTLATGGFFLVSDQANLKAFGEAEGLSQTGQPAA